MTEFLFCYNLCILFVLCYVIKKDRKMIEWTKYKVSNFTKSQAGLFLKVVNYLNIKNVSSHQANKYPL